MSPTQARNCAAWIGFFTELGTNGVPSLDQVEQITTPEVRFRDPFNDLKGRTALRSLFEHTVQQIDDLQFEVLDQVAAGLTVYLKWRMTGRAPVLGYWQVDGMSELVFDTQGRLALHQDHWDSGELFYGRLPGIGWLVRLIRLRAAVKTKAIV
jgi:steroid delta-isomerase